VSIFKKFKILDFMSIPTRQGGLLLVKASVRIFGANDALHCTS